MWRGYARRMKRVRTRIIGTLGPASAKPGVLRRLVEAGLDVARLNFSHGTRGDHERAIRLVRALNTARGRRLRILQDLEGPRIRVGSLPTGPIALARGGEHVLVREGERRREEEIPIDYEGPFAGFRGAGTLYFDDGTIAVRVAGVKGDHVRVRVEVGGTLKQHKGLNAPEARLEFPVLSDDDASNLAFGLERGVDFVAQSFVRSRREVAAIAERLRASGTKALVVAKIEEREGVANLDRILDVADGIMVARGDMGVSLPPWEVPLLQKHLVRRARARGKFAIVATQMLESMTANARPTRAEVSDVANAILDGADYVMLSGETAVGKHPVAAVTMMNSIARHVEAEGGPYRPR